MINFKEINRKNLFKIIFLSVHQHQEDQVATNAESIAQAHYEDNAWFRGIFKDDEPLGFVMLDIDHKTKTMEFGVL